MSLAKKLIDDSALAEQWQRAGGDPYYGEEWPSEQECLDDAEGYPAGESFRPSDQASTDD